MFRFTITLFDEVFLDTARLLSVHLFLIFSLSYSPWSPSSLLSVFWPDVALYLAGGVLPSIHRKQRRSVRHFCLRLQHFSHSVPITHSGSGHGHHSQCPASAEPTLAPGHCLSSLYELQLHKECPPRFIAVARQRLEQRR